MSWRVAVDSWGGRALTLAFTISKAARPPGRLFHDRARIPAHAAYPPYDLPDRRLLIGLHGQVTMTATCDAQNN